MTLLLLFFFLSIIFSFLCSVWEAVLLSITPAYSEIIKHNKPVLSKSLDVFKANIDRPLSAILTLNTIAHTVGAIGVGAQAVKIWSDMTTNIAGLSINIAGVIVPTVMTLAILILSEIIPKTIGANYWKGLTPFTIRSLNFVIKVLFPLVWLSQLITKSLKKNKDESVLSRADFSAMARLGSKEGVIAEDESNIILNLLKFKNIKASDIMTPRTVVQVAPEEMTIQEFFDGHPQLRFSRIPIFKETKDHITGFFLKDDLLEALVNKSGDDQLHSIMRAIMIVSETAHLPQLFSKLMKEKEHIALVVDEFGGMAGIVTMEDVIETLLGMEIVDEFDNIEDMQAMARKNWERRAKALGILDKE